MWYIASWTWRFPCFYLIFLYYPSSCCVHGPLNTALRSVIKCAFIDWNHIIMRAETTARRRNISNPSGFVALFRLNYNWTWQGQGTGLLLQVYQHAEAKMEIILEIMRELKREDLWLPQDKRSWTFLFFCVQLWSDDEIGKGLWCKCCTVWDLPDGGNFLYVVFRHWQCATLYWVTNVLKGYAYTLKMKAADSSETLVASYRSTHCYNRRI